MKKQLGHRGPQHLAQLEFLPAGESEPDPVAFRARSKAWAAGRAEVKIKPPKSHFRNNVLWNTKRRRKKVLECNPGLGGALAVEEGGNLALVVNNGPHAQQIALTVVQQALRLQNFPKPSPTRWFHHSTAARSRCCARSFGMEMPLGGHLQGEQQLQLRLVLFCFLHHLCFGLVLLY